jgi:dihydrofolate synthase/folylpolyglutamate synthase
MRRYGFDESIGLLEGLYRLPLRPTRAVGLRRAEFLLSRLGNPHGSFRTVHVTGSCGKGSTTTMIGSILEAAGFRTGYFLSPHLHSYRERVAVNGENIIRLDWERCFNRVWPSVQAMCSGDLPDYDLGRPALFEVLFAIGCLHFAETGVAWAAAEAGLGGRLDATNLLRSDVAVITNVSLEHTEVLGDTVSAVAKEKAAIIKRGGRAVTATQDPVALSVIRRRAADVDAPLLEVGKDIRVSIVGARVGRQRLIVDTPHSSMQIDLPLGGHFQALNAAAAVGAAAALRERGVGVNDDAIIAGLSTVTVPGRFEVMRRDPLIILDGAHNPAAARELRHSLLEVLHRRRLVLLFAAMADKDVAAMARELGPLAETVVVTRTPGSDRAAPASSAAEAFAPWSQAVETEDEADRALELALNILEPTSVLVVTGSLYLVGSIRHALTSSMVPA